MPDVRRTPENMTRAGIDLTDISGLLTADVQIIRNNGKVFLHFKKTGAGDCTVTFSTPGTVDGLAIADRTVTVPATTGDIHVGPFPPHIYNDSVRDLRVSLSEVTGLTMAVAQMP